MARGKQTCKILKEIRRQIAEANGIEFVTSECRYKGDCLGTCPKCEAEVRYLEQQLRSRQRMGKAIALAGISAGAIAMFSPVNVSAQHPDPDLSLPMGDIAVHAVTDTFMVKGSVWQQIDSNGVKQREPLIGATVINLRNKEGIATDIDGNFEIEVTGGDTLEVSYIGYHAQRIPVKQWTDYIEVILEENADMLTGDIVFTGAFGPVRSHSGMLDLYIVDENKKRIPLSDITIHKIFIDEDGEEDEELVEPMYIEDDTALRFYWNEDRELQDKNGKPLKEATLRIEADGYDGPVIIKVKYPKRNAKKTIKFKHKKG